MELKWLKEPEDARVPVGKSVYIPCIADGIPRPTIEWTRLGDGEQSIWYPQAELRLGSVSQNDSGSYECRARNGVDKDLIRRVELEVLGK